MKKRMKSVVAIGIITALVFGIAGCGSGNEKKDVPDSTASSETQTLKTVRIGAVGQNNVLSDAIGIADNQGFLKEELEKAGYEPEVTGFAQAGPAINEAFASEEIDMAIYGDLPATVAKSNGTDTTIFATHVKDVQLTESER